jgi:hydroxyacylglutathione hydrolase
VYAYVVLDDREVWLIDSGVAATEALIETYLHKIGRDMDDVSTLVLTHSHPDHIGAAAAIQDATDCDVLVHETERALMSHLEDAGR